MDEKPRVDERPADKHVAAILNVIALAFLKLFADGFFSPKPWWATALCLIIAIGLYLLGQKWPELRAKSTSRIVAKVTRIAPYVKVLVFIGVFIFFYAQFRSIRNDLDLYVMPRTVSKIQKEQFRQAMEGRQFTNHFYVAANCADREACEYAMELVATFKNAKLTCDYCEVNPWETNQIDERIGSDFRKEYTLLDQGLVIRVCDAGQYQNFDSDHPAPHQLLTEAMGKAHIEPDGGSGRANCGTYSFCVEVGRRKTEPPSSTSLRMKLITWLINHEF